MKIEEMMKNFVDNASSGCTETDIEIRAVPAKIESILRVPMYQHPGKTYIKVQFAANDPTIHIPPLMIHDHADCISGKLKALQTIISLFSACKYSTNWIDLDPIYPHVTLVAEMQILVGSSVVVYLPGPSNPAPLYVGADAEYRE